MTEGKREKLQVEPPLRRSTTAMSAQEEEEEPEVIVLDGGSGSMKAGFSGEDAPRSVFPNVVGQSRDAKRRRAGDTRDTVVGQQAQDKREMLALRYPVERGQVTRWDDMERVWEWALHEELEVDPEAMTYPVRRRTCLCKPLQCAGRRGNKARGAWPR